MWYLFESRRYSGFADQVGQVDSPFSLGLVHLLHIGNIDLLAHMDHCLDAVMLAVLPEVFVPLHVGLSREQYDDCALAASKHAEFVAPLDLAALCDSLCLSDALYQHGADRDDGIGERLVHVGI